MVEYAHTAVPLLPKQAEFVFDSTHDELLYSGAFGAGKSRGLCYRSAVQARDPRARVGLTRKRMTDLKRTTLRTLLEKEGDLDPVLPEGSYRYYKTPGQERIDIKGGGEIVLFGCDEPTRIGSMQFSDLNIDEGIELDEEEWNMLSGRCRIAFKLGGGRTHKPTMATATNPAGPEHFLFKKFFREIADLKDGLRKCIETCMFDNFFLPQSYIHKQGMTLHGTARLRYIFGKWVGAEGLVYPMFTTNMHVMHNEGPWKYYVAGVDAGFTNPMVLRVHGVDGDGRSHVVGSFYQSGLVSEEFIEWCTLAAETWSPITFMPDPSAAELIERMRRAGFDVHPANNDVQLGIQTVRNRLTPQGDGRPRLTFEPLHHEIDGRTVSAHAEYQSYVLKENDPSGKEAPVKQHDHVPDADRYACVAIEEGMGGTHELVMIESPETDRWSSEERMWSGS